MLIDNPKLKRADRILVLKPVEGEKTTSSKGLVDPRLFKGENKLHAVMDSRNCMWRLRYEAGQVPGPLQQTFTNFDKAFKTAQDYFAKRGVEIVEVID